MYFTDHTTVFHNGEWLHVSEIKADLYSQTMHYGLGAFEGMRAYKTPLGTQIFRANEHYRRLLASCEMMGIKCDYSVEDLVAYSYELLNKNNLKNAYIRPLAYMDANMALRSASSANLFICAWEWGPLLGEKLLKVMSSSFQRPNPRSLHVEAKVSGHYVNSILAANEAKANGYDEALLTDMNGNVAQGPGANFFFEKDGVLYTAPRGHILPGITRATIMELARDLDIRVREEFFKTEDVEGADAAFFTGTAAEVIGLESLNGIKFKKPWDTTHGYTLRHAYKSLVLSAEAHIIDVV